MAITTLTDNELSGGRKYTAVQFTTAGSSATFDVSDTILQTFSMQCEVPSGIMLVVNVVLEGSVNGNNWDTILSLTSLLDLAKVKISNPSPVGYYRITVSSLSLGTAPYLIVGILGVS